MGGEEGRETLVGGVGLGDHDDAGGVLVDPVDDARAGDAADAGEARARVVQQGVDEGAAFAPRRRVDRHAGRLVDHDQVLVLEEHAERDGLGLWLGGDRRRDLDAVAAGLGLGGGVGDDRAVAAHPALGKQGLDAGPRELRRQIGQHLVDAGAGVLGAHRDDAHAEGFGIGVVGIEAVRVRLHSPA